MKNAFTLVELSIVLVILGLLVGGVLAGQNLIRAAELRAVTTEFTQFQTAVMTFKEKYFALPGDMDNATDFWGTASACPGDADDARTTTATCNGDANGTIRRDVSTSNEAFSFWQHLANAELIEGTYTGVSSSTSDVTSVHSTVGVNIPESKLDGAGWYTSKFSTDPMLLTSTVYIEGFYGNYFIFGANTTSSAPVNPALVPEEAWNIDTKIDDGIAGSGKLVAREFQDDCFVGSRGSTALEGVAYDLAVTTVECTLVFKNNY